MTVRTRFAPSPTGSLHIGGLRTALFSFMFARHYGGQFILRIEDTDQSRLVDGARERLMESMQWAGIRWDEGPDIGGFDEPYVQSERLVHYRSVAHTLIENGMSYYDDGAVRFRAPQTGETVVKDSILGTSVFKNEGRNDAVLLKSDGFPTYHLAHVTDDHMMGITHVIRAVEWYPSLPLHWQLWDALGWEKPVYMHTPVMLNPNGKGKMSKRNPPLDSAGNVIPVLVHDYIAAGYLPEAVVNFVTTTGWNYGRDDSGKEVDVYSLNEAIHRFDGTRINKNNAALPIHKMSYFQKKWAHRLKEVSR